MNLAGSDAVVGADEVSTWQLQEPIIVGYAFGPKKMATMGVVMAEASRANLLSSLVRIDRYPQLQHSSTKGQQQQPKDNCVLKMKKKKKKAAKSAKSVSIQPLTRAALQERYRKDYDIRNRNSDHSYCEEEGHPSRILFSSANLKRVVRTFRSSCSSIDTSEEHNQHLTTSITSSTASIITSTTLRKGSMSSHASSSNNNTNTNSPLHPVRVSFVPLDLNEPIEEQHGGNFDIILHKMTEDILFKSTLQQEQHPTRLSVSEREAVDRIQRLNQYAASHPRCSLVDHPDCVQVLMNRLNIAERLRQSLVGVRSTSGYTVGTPRFIGYNQDNADVLDLEYPLVAKPITAAGTKKSHCMAIILNESGLLPQMMETPCLLQEYANHNGVLFKVYVLGDRIDVFERVSLPNLPIDKETLATLPPYVEFDSQRPYPTTQDFGLIHTTATTTTSSASSSSSPFDNSSGWTLSKDEIDPVVTALKQAFGLELFGFDILVTNSGELMVVDVNYFPSYKEVENFPTQLAKYLTQRAMNTRSKCE